jgi:uncharacterized membrane protein HdeD (DUF308 family)
MTRKPTRLLFGIASVAYGIVGLYAHHHAQPTATFAQVAAILEIAGGAAIVVTLSEGVGAALLLAAYLITTLLTVPGIVSAPSTYNSWGNAFEQLSLLTGALLVFAGFSAAIKPRAVQRTGRLLIGACSASFALEQAFYLKPTASLVPTWIPPNQMLWAYATTLAFALAAIALIIDRSSLLAARLLTAMIALFGIVVWLPSIVAHPHDLISWSEGAETFAIAGATWILADLLAGRVSHRR